MPTANLLVQGDASRLPLADKSVDLCFGSPPYVSARLYLENGENLGISRDCRSWVDWMLAVTTEAVRVSKGLVLWNCAGITRDHRYQPACEGLLWEWYKRGGRAWRPVFWHRVGIPGSGGKKWLRADVEYILAFLGDDLDFYTDNTACGHPPKWAPGGEMSHRLGGGQRVNQWGMNVKEDGTLTATNRGAGGGGDRDQLSRRTTKPSHIIGYKNAFGVRTDVPIGTRADGLKDADKEGYRAHTKRRADGTMEDRICIPPVLANPGNYHEWEFGDEESAWLEEAYGSASPVLHIAVGGGQLGSKYSHENEAPFPESLAKFFVKSFSPAGGIVLDPFSGSATTVAVSGRLDRHGIGLDLRRSQCDLGRRRIADSLRPRNPRLDPPPARAPLPGQLSFLD